MYSLLVYIETGKEYLNRYSDALALLESTLEKHAGESDQ